MSMADVPNSDVGMLLFHGSAALFDLIVMCCAQQIITGQICDAFETTCIVSMGINFVGFLAYVAYAPPIFYNVSMWGLYGLQWLVLFIPGDGDAYFVGRDLVRRLATMGAYQNSKEANQ